MRIGAHVSIAKSLDLAIDRAVEIGAECIQIFGCAPQQWQFLVFPEGEIGAFKRKAREHDISPIFVHSVYLINLASENPFIFEKSLTSLIQYLEFSSLANAEGVVLHIGSHKGRGWRAVKKQVFEAIEEILRRTEGCTYRSRSAPPIPQPFGLKTVNPKGFPRRGSIILENSAGAGGIIGAEFSELGEIIRAVKSPRVKVCLDTAHAFESGYSLSRAPNPKGLSSQPFGLKGKTDRSTTPNQSKHGSGQASEVSGRTTSLDETLEEFDHEIGLDRLVLIHANDSKTPLGSNVDRHENIGEGHIGEEGFHLITHDPRLSHLPFIIETPGFDKKGVDKKNLDTLKRLASTVAGG